MCVCVSDCMCMIACMCACLPVCMYTGVCTYVCMYVCMYVCVCPSVRINAHAYIHPAMAQQQHHNQPTRSHDCTPAQCMHMFIPYLHARHYPPAHNHPHTPTLHNRAFIRPPTCMIFRYPHPHGIHCRTHKHGHTIARTHTQHMRPHTRTHPLTSSSLRHNIQHTHQHTYASHMHSCTHTYCHLPIHTHITEQPTHKKRWPTPHTYTP